MPRDLYEILELTPEADQTAVITAYRRLVFTVHPDRNNSPEAVVRTSEINHAYRVLSNPSERARYDQRRSPTATATAPVPRAVLGTSKLTLYDWLESKPRHRHIRWEPGIWSTISNHFPDCKARGCLVLLRIDPGSGKQTYQHGDPGPVLHIDPERGEFKLLEPWLAHCHQLDDSA